MTAEIIETCLACSKPVDTTNPGDKFSGVSPFGLKLKDFFLHDKCLKSPFQDKVCLVCHQPETPSRMGNPYEVSNAAGKQVWPFWLCNDDAPFAGPPQGVTEVYMEDMRRLNK